MEFTCRAILFDLDGVLINSSKVIERHWKIWADSHHISFKQLMGIAHGRTSAEIIRLFAPHLDAKQEGFEREAAEGVDVDGLEVFASARELLLRLPPGSWAVVTSGNILTATTRLRFGNFPSPQVLITSEDVQKSKPDPEPYLFAAQRLQIPPEQCVVIEDSPAGISAAHSAGMRVIAVSTTHPPQEIIEADFITNEIAGISVNVKGEELSVIIDPIQTE